MLLLTYHYPPDVAVGGLRPSRLVEQLVAAGHEVDVITASMRREAPGLRASGSGWRVFAVRRWQTPRDWYLRMTQGRRRQSAPGTRDVGPAVPVRQVQAARGGVLGFLRRQVLSLLWFPAEHQGFLPAVVGAACRLSKERPYDVVYSTAPPHILHVTGWIVSRALRLPWIMEYRDPWLGNKPREVITAWSARGESWLEGKCLRRARTVVTVTETFAEKLRGRVTNPSRVVCVRNGIPKVSEVHTGANDGRFVVRHMGTVYARRDPMPIFRALAELRDRAHATAERFVLEFIGLVHVFRGRSLEDMAREAGVADLVRFLPRVGQEECARLTAEADLLLLLAQEQPMQVPNKLYDYLAAGTPILALADPDGETATMLGRIGTHAVLDPGAAPSVIANAIRAAMQGNGARPAVAAQVREQLAEWSVELQFARLLELVETAAGLRPAQPADERRRLA